MKSAIVFILAMLIVTPVIAGPPLNGTYKSEDLGGPVLAGRYTESWAGPGGRLALGNTTNKYSWDGATLGTQWWMYCAEISAAPILLFDGVDGSGNGQRIYQVTYNGGFCVLFTGPWTNGEASYFAPYDSYTEIKTQTYVSFGVVGEVATVQVQASFTGFNDDCMALQIASSAEVGDTDSSAKPGDFPDFLEPGFCTGTRVHGTWGDHTGMTLDIFDCTIATEESTWGAIKAQYQN